MFRQLLDFGSYQHFGDLSTIFFFLLFVGIVAYVLFLDKSHVNRMSELPLDADETDASHNGE